MTQVFGEDGAVARVTVLEAGPCYVTAIRTQRARRLRGGAARLRCGPREGARASPSSATSRRPRRRRCATSASSAARAPASTVGETVNADVFEPGQRVKVSGTSKGKGFQGTVKRHRFSRGPVTHGSHNTRAPGSIGASAWPARVMKGIRGPGQMGNKRVTQRGLEVVEVRAAEHLLFIRGAVPGSRGGYVEVRTDG